MWLLGEGYSLRGASGQRVVDSRSPSASGPEARSGSAACGGHGRGWQRIKRRHYGSGAAIGQQLTVVVLRKGESDRAPPEQKGLAKVGLGGHQGTDTQTQAEWNKAVFSDNTSRPQLGWNDGNAPSCPCHQRTPRSVVHELTFSGSNLCKSRGQMPRVAHDSTPGRGTQPQQLGSRIGISGGPTPTVTLLLSSARADLGRSVSVTAEAHVSGTCWWSLWTGAARQRCSSPRAPV